MWCDGGVYDTTVFSVFLCFVSLEHWCVERRQASGRFAAVPLFSPLFLARVGIGMDRCRSAPAPKTGSDSCEMALSVVGV